MSVGNCCHPCRSVVLYTWSVPFLSPDYWISASAVSHTGNTGIVKHLISWNDRVHVKWGRGRASPINSLAWQYRGEMIVGNFPTRQCVECVGERRGGAGALNGKRSVEVVHTCVSVCETVCCPPAQLCWKAASVWSSQLGLFYLACWSCVNSLRGYRPAWHGGVCAGLPAVLWMRGQQVDVVVCKAWWQQDFGHPVHWSFNVWSCCVKHGEAVRSQLGNFPEIQLSIPTRKGWLWSYAGSTQSPGP